MIDIQKIHHVAYRCKNAKETTEFYQKMLGMELLVCISEEKVPSTKEPNPYIHIFLDAGMGNILAFFEITGEKEMSRDPNTPLWVQHIAFQLKDLEALKQAKKYLEDQGLDVLGLTDHGIFQSIYFFDPNGHRLELTAMTSSDKQLKTLKEIAPKMLEEWNQTKRPPKDASWLHENEFNPK